MRRRRQTVSLCAAVAAAFTTSHAFAADTDFFWKSAPVSGDITDQVNNYTSTANVGNGDVFFLGNASLSFPNPTTPFNPGKLRIGHLFGPNPGPATLTMTGGSITPGGANSASALTGLGDKGGLVVGFNTNGTLAMSGTSSMTVTEYVVVGHDAPSDAVTGTGTGIVTLSNSALLRSTNNDFVLGNGNRGEVTVSNNASLLVLPTNLASTRGGDLTVGASVQSLFTMNDSAIVNVANSVQVGSGSTFTMNGGTLTTRAKDASHGFSTIAANGNLTIGPTTTTPSSGSNFVMNAGTVNVGNQMSVGQNNTTNASFTIENGTLTTKTAVVPTPAPTPTPSVNGNISVGTGTAAGSKMIIHGGTIVAHQRFLMGTTTGSTVSSGTGHVTTQTNGSMTIDLNAVIADTGGEATYNLSGGTLTTNSATDLSRVGRHGTGTMNQSGGVATFGGGLAIGDDDPTSGTGPAATGTYEISAGTLHSNLASGGALRVGTNGVGTFRVVGDDGIVDVNGAMLVDKTAKGTGTLMYKFESGDTLSVVDVSGTATFSNGAGLGVDTSAALPFHQAYDVLTAASIVDNGASDSPGWTHRVINGGINGKLLQIAPSDTLYWDIDGVNPGSGGPTPSGTWTTSTTNFTTDPAGAGATTALTTAFGDDVVFGAGTDGTGSYTVTVSGTQTARSLSVARGNVTISGGTIENTSGNYDVANGATATFSGTTLSTVALNKTGVGKMVVDRIAESHTVNIQAGTLQVADSSPTLPAFPSGQNSAVSRPGSMITIANDGAPLGTRTYSATLDLGNNDLIIDYTGSSPFADLNDMVRSGFNFGDWLGKGITSSTAANPLSNGNYALGIAENGQLTNPFGNDDPNDPNSLNPKFDDQTVDNTTVLIKFTHRVDLDLNGLVDGNDAAIFNGSFSEGDGGATWQTGDVDYDGVYSSNDAAIFNSFYDESLGHLPEPSTAALALVAVSGLALRRRRSAKSR